MALILANRVKETTTTTGTGTVTLAGAASGFQSFAAIGNGNITYYTISGGTEWEVGIGTYTSAGPTLSRTTVLASSNAGALVTFSAGSKEVICTYPAEKAVIEDDAGNVGIGATLPGATGISPFIAIGANNAGIGSASANVLSVVTSNTERMRIHAAGGVSIGTTTDPGANNVTANSFQDGYTTTATAAGTTTLTVASTGIQYFTGTTTQTLVLPVTSTLQLGWTYHVANTSTGIVTVQSSGANVIVAIPPGLSVMFTCILTSGTTAASWDYGFTDFPAVTPVGSASLNNSLFRLNANGAAIGPAIADYFGTNSAVTLAAASVYELEFELFFTKTTAGTVTFTLTSDNAPVNLNAYWIGTAVGGVGTAAASPQAALVASTATAAALPATGSLTTAVNHHYIIKVVLNTHATLAETIRLRITSSAGTVTPLRNSRYTVKNLTTDNSGTFVA